MSDSILQVNQIKDKGGNATGITVADSTANISIGTTLAVNTINEVTSANGVTIDGLSLKDGNVVPAAGKGIDFSAASGSASGSSSALLDDYEEGTWTPTGTNLHSLSTGSYVKVGNMVFIWGHIRTNGTGLNAFGGLPFTPVTGTTAGYGSAGKVGGFEGSVGSVAIGTSVNVTSTGDAIYLTNGWVGSTGLSLGTYGTFVFTGQYKVS